jgi:muconolactone delta-isomerase
MDHHWHDNIDADELNRLHDRAHARAARLRAAAIDDLWRRLGTLLSRRHDPEGDARATLTSRHDDRLGGAHC